MEKFFKSSLEFGFWLAVYVVYIGIVALSGYVNFLYGADISKIFGALFVFFSASEVLLPLLGLRCRNIAMKGLCNTVALALLVVSMVTAVSFLVGENYKANQASKGTIELLQGRAMDIQAANKLYEIAISSAIAAQSACERAIERNAKDPGKGFVKRRCQEASRATEAAERQKRDLDQMRGVMESKSQEVKPASQAISESVSKFVGFPQSVVMFAMYLAYGLLGAWLVWVYGRVISHIKSADSVKKDAQKQPEEKETDSVPKGPSGGKPSPDGSGGGKSKKKAPVKKPAPAPEQPKGSNVIPFKSSPKARLKSATKVRGRSKKSSLDRDIELAKKLISEGVISCSVRSLESKKAKARRLSVGRKRAQEIVQAINKSNQSKKGESVSE